MGRRYWRSVARNYEGKETEFKDVVIKDAEVLGVLAALLVTVALAGLAMSDGGLSQQSALRTTYVSFMFLALCTSGLALYISSRNVLTLNKLPATDISRLLDTLEYLETVWASNAFPFFVVSLLSILIAATLGVNLLYNDHLCTQISIALALLSAGYAFLIERSHVSAVKEFINGQHCSGDEPGHTFVKLSRDAESD
eukprot:TRINITY_DN98593_c0_g1_i1.p1 TRINITY_DN98593_c0_g1~~TRINITY_DN98593_c0_g1_i1.p1  ORF type:complete len:197 (+),score=24.60 TRINITY_DN98593_c0_g1_i1:45-635(+)